METGIDSRFDPATGVATITLTMPGRVNKIDAAFGIGLDAALTAALSAPGLRGIVVASGHKDFCVGGDIDALYAASDAATFLAQVRALDALFRRIETCGVPVVAALTGSALGGGLELALACHARIVLLDPRVQLGLPEVNLGLLPGAGGTQRLPRMLGIQGALELLTQGTLVRAPRARAAGLVDDGGATPEEVVDKAVAWIHAHPGAKQPWDRSDWKWPDPDPASSGARALVMGACAMVFKKTAGTMPAPEAIVSVVQEGARLSFDRAVEVEARAFTRLALSAQAKDMIRTLWYHKNAADRHVGLPTATDERIRKVTILGAGMMGAGLAFSAASKGYDVVLRDISAEALEKGLAHCREQVAGLKHLAPDARATVLARITGTVELGPVAGSDLVIEAVIEDLAVKHRVIREIEPLLAADAIFASNTSALPITELATASAHPERFVGLHFFSPVERMPLIEIIRGARTDEDTLGRVLAFSRVIGKLPIVVMDGYGFYTTRVFSAYILEGAQLVAEGYDPVLVEWAARTAGMMVPPLQVFDEVSLRLARHAMEQARRYLPDAQELEGLTAVRRMVDELDRPGRLAGRGFYTYEDGRRGGLWPGLSTLADGRRAQASVEALADRLMYAQIAEVARKLEDGVLRTRRDAEVGAVFGIGFSPGSGGPLAWMDRRGLPRVVRELDALADALGPRFRPTEALRQMADADARFWPVGTPPT